MLLGEYEHTLDDKNRLTLPAKFRTAMADGVVLTRGLDSCVEAYPAADWTGLVESSSPGSTRSAARAANSSASTTRAPSRRSPTSRAA